MHEYISEFESWEKAFLFITKQSQEKRIIIVIDEFPYLANTNKSILSILQNTIDHNLIESNIHLIICGSSMSFMENEVLGYKSPIYGRRTTEIKVEPFDYYDSSKFFPNYSNEEKMIAYGILGGIPQYLLQFDPNQSIENNIKDKILRKYSYLYSESLNFLKQELREPSYYNTIIEAIANGASKMNEIVTKVNSESSKVGIYLNVLIELRIIKKIKPINDKINSRKSIYRIEDNFFNFYYKFIYPYKSLIEMEQIDYLYKNKIENELSNYMGKIFEKICMEYIERMNKSASFSFIIEEIGTWWGNNPILKREEEIDIIALGNDSILYSECKWTNSKVTKAHINSLREKSRLLVLKENNLYALFSKSGFNKELVKEDDLYLYNLDSLFDFEN
jgi:AAA+ ATPase superfamily predicted ATPase